MALDQPRRRLTGVIDQNIHPAETRDRLADQLLAVLVGCDIHRNGERLRADLSDQLGGLRERLRAARADHHLRALPRQPDRRRPSDALAAAGDDRDLALESELHDILLWFRRRIAAPL